MASSEGSGVTTGQPNLHKQDLSKLDVTTLTAVSPEVISRQATINIGTIGHVAHGKSTVVKAISGVQTVRFKNELERNITIKLERVQFDANDGLISWPAGLLGVRISNADRPPTRRSFRKRSRPISESSSLDNSSTASSSSSDSPPAKKQRGPQTIHTFVREFVVERILDHKIQGNRLYFEVKWEGYEESKATWEPLEHLTNCPNVFRTFLAEHLGKHAVEKLYNKFDIAGNLSNTELLDMVPKLDMTKLPDKLSLQHSLFRLLVMEPKDRGSGDLEQGKRDLLLYKLVLKREQQLAVLKKWEETINQMSTDHAIIAVENNVDLEGPPERFTYVNNYISNGKIKIMNKPSAGCSCTECRPRTPCCGIQPHGGFTYTNNGRMNVNPGIAIYECNRLCKCDRNCRNRVVQNGRKVPLCIFRTANGCGWGVKAMRRIGCGEFVCEYVGELITHEEAEIRGQSYDAEGRTYLFDLDYNSRDNPYTVDAAHYGNVSHFINHSCDPNLGVYAVWINCGDPNLPQLALFALREIQKDEELTFDYMMNPDITTPEKARPKLTTPNKNDVTQEGRSICKCAADSCRRYLF